MFRKRRVCKQDGKEHFHYALSESLRVHSGRAMDCAGMRQRFRDNI